MIALDCLNSPAVDFLSKQSRTGLSRQSCSRISLHRPAVDCLNVPAMEFLSRQSALDELLNVSHFPLYGTLRLATQSDADELASATQSFSHAVARSPSHSVSGLAAVLLSVTQSLSHSIIQSFSHSKLNSSAPSRVSTYIPVSTTLILSAPSRVLSVDLPEYFSSFKCAL